MHQVIGSVRKQRAATHSKVNSNAVDSNAALSAQICRKQASGDSAFGVQSPFGQVSDKKSALSSCHLAVDDDDDDDGSAEDQQLSAPNDRGASPGLDPQTYSQISRLLEIRRNPLQPMNSKSTLRRRESTVSRLLKRTYSLAKRKHSHITSMMTPEDEEWLPSVPVFHPYSGPRMIWDLSIIFLILWTAISVPLRLSWALPENLKVWVMDRVLDLVFMIDIAINFNTAFERGTELILDRRSILRHYLRTWFALDFIASFPFDFFISLINGGRVLSFNDEAQNTSLSLLPRLVRLFKLSRLFRLARLQRILRRVQLQLGIRNSTNKILKFSGAAILCAHWMACMFYATSTFGASSLGAFPSWVERLDQDNRNQLDADSVAHTYIASLYWSLTTMTSIGYGDVSPKTPSERLFGIFGMICGAVLFGHFMGNVLAVVADMSPAENEFHLKMDMLNVYMKEQNLSTELRRQIEEFYHIEHKLNCHQVDEAEVLKELPDRLKQELSLAISRRILGNVPLFEGMSASFIRTVGLSMERRVYPQGEFVIREGSEVHHFYILTAGRALLMAGDQVIGSLRNGDYFGSIPIHLNQIAAAPLKSAYSVRTLEWTEVRSLSISIFRQLITGQLHGDKAVLVRRIAENLLSASKKDRDDGDHSDCQIGSASTNQKQPERERGRAAAADCPSPPQRIADIDRAQLIKFVENALSLDQPQRERAAAVSEQHRGSEEKAKGQHLRRRSDRGDERWLSAMRRFEAESEGHAQRVRAMRQRLSDELSTFDAVMATLSLMTDVPDSEAQRERMMRCLRHIADRQLLDKTAALRKAIEYFLADTAPNAPSPRPTATDNGIASFFRPFVFLREKAEISRTLRPRTPSIASKGHSLHRRDSGHFDDRALYRGHCGDCREAVEMMLFQMGYRPTFSDPLHRDDEPLEVVAARGHFDVVMADNDDIQRIGEELRALAAALRNQEEPALLCVVSNCTRFAELTEVANEYGVHAILRKPVLLQHLQQLFKRCGLAPDG